MAGRKTPKQRHALPLRFSLDSKEAAEQRYQVDQAFILSGERFLNDFLLDVVMKAARKRLASLSAADLEDLRKKGRPYKG